jgi:hypothetical protein
MKTINLSIVGIAVLSIMFSCSSDKQVQLSKLKEQQTVLGDKIKTIEDQLKAAQKDVINPDEFKFVGVTEVKTETFDHFIRVQGKSTVTLMQLFLLKPPVLCRRSFLMLDRQLLKVRYWHRLMISSTVASSMGLKHSINLQRICSISKKTFGTRRLAARYSSCNRRQQKNHSSVR